MPRRRSTCLLAAVVAALATAPPAAAETALEQYQRTGRINPCTVTGGPGDIPNDVEQYAPDFRDAYNSAMARGCNTGSVSQTRPTDTDEGVPVASGAPLPPGATFVPRPPAPPRVAGATQRPTRYAPLAIAEDRSTPAPVIALGVMLLLFVVGAGLAAGARYMGWGLDRLDPVRRGFAEAGARTGDALAAAAERVRAALGRGA